MRVLSRDRSRLFHKMPTFIEVITEEGNVSEIDFHAMQIKHYLHS